MTSSRRNTVASYQENLEPARRKRKYDLREIWNAIFGLVKTGCQWCSLRLRENTYDFFREHDHEKMKLGKIYNKSARYYMWLAVGRNMWGPRVVLLKRE